MNRSLLALATLFAAAWPSYGRAAGIPPFDAVSLASADRQLAYDALPPGERVLHHEARLGLPTFVWAASAPQPAPAAGNFEQIAWGHVQRHAALYRLGDAALAQLRLVRLHDTGRGAVVATYVRTIDGVEVFKDRLRVVLDRKGGLVAITGFVAPDAPVSRAFPVEPARALSLAARELGSDLAPKSFVEAGSDAGGFARFDAPGLERHARIRPVWFHLPGMLRPAWHVELETGGGHVAWVIDALEGSVLWRHDLVQDASYRVWADPAAGNLPFDGPQGTLGSPHPTAVPDAFQAPTLAPALIDLQSGPISTGDPWLPAGATETVGNNVDAYTDRAAPDGRALADKRASATSPGVFDRPYDLGLDPDANVEQSMASATQLFFVTNWLHDWFYDAGFDEEAGNAQDDNFGRGGAGRDRLFAEAQDYAGFDNANMGTPADGDNPRMQMFIFSANFERRVSVVAPASAATSYAVGVAGFGPQQFDVTGELVIYDDGVDTRSDGCEPPVNDLVGKVALIDRGTCPFSEKTKRAEDAGAAGVIIVNNENGFAPGMGGDETGVTIGVLSLSQTDGNALRQNPGVTVQLFRELAINRDSALDTTVVAHEFTHMVSSRLIGNATGLGNNQGGGLGEGWSDFASLVFLVRAEDAAQATNADFGGTYGVGTWVSSGGGNAGYYYGMRRYPYSVDFARNPLTFRHIENDVQLPSTAPFAFGRSGRINAEAHRTGEVWAEMLWECYVSLLRDTSRFTFVEARQHMLELLVASFAITPNDPTVLEARDALLAAAWASDPADYELFFRAFARRGAGLDAQGPDRWSDDHHTVTESYDAGYDLELVDARIDDTDGGCDEDGILDAGESGTLVLRLRNRGIGSLEASTARVTSATPGITIGATGTLAVPATQPLQEVEVAVPIAAGDLTAKTRLEVRIELADPAFGAPRETTWSTWAQFDDRPAASRTDDVESAHTTWTPTANPLFSTDTGWQRVFVAGGGYRWHGPAVGTRADLSLVSPVLEVGAQPLLIHFRHRHAFEVRDSTPTDGGIVEISTDGRTWSQVTAEYGGALANGVGNPLGGKQAFVGTSAGWPDMTDSTVDLGTRYAGRTVRVRFRVGSDVAFGGPGWEIDDIAFEGITNQPFAAGVEENGNCENQPPVAVISGLRTGLERAETVADGSGSYDVDWDPLTYRWSQVDGPEVEWLDQTSAVGRFVAPEVTRPTQITLQLEVSDGAQTNAATASFLIREVNLPPVAAPRAPAFAVQGSVVQLDGTASSDPDGDALTYAWEQVDGPAVELDDPGAATPHFTAPAVEAETVLSFALVVSDGDLESDAVKVDVRVVVDDQAPVVTVGGALEVEEGGRIGLVGTATDREEQPLTFRWTQIAGTAAVLENADSAEATLVAPEVEADETLTFQLVASDGTNESAPATVDVRVINRVEPGPNPRPGDTRPKESGCGCTGAGPSAAVQFGAWAVVALGLRRRRRA